MPEASKTRFASSAKRSEEQLHWRMLIKHLLSKSIFVYYIIYITYIYISLALSYWKLEATVPFWSCTVVPLRWSGGSSQADLLRRQGRLLDPRP